MPPDIDLVIAFRATKTSSLSKQQIRQDARKAEQQYARLVKTLTNAGLKAVGRRGESLGHLLVFVTCPEYLVDNLIKRERHSDFLSGLPVTPVASGTHVPLSPADRIRLVHAYITCTHADGGLGITQGAHEWDLVESILPLHDRVFNETWARSWTLKNITSVRLENIREQFGDSLALYFAFLSTYTRFLAFPALLGLISHFILPPYSPLYSILLGVWAIAFVEYWRVHERILSLRFGSRGSFRVEKRRAQYKHGLSWYGRELRVLASIPVILLFAGVLVTILTGIFVFEAFITHLYQGPGKLFISLAPTLLFVALVPRFMAIYHALAVRLTAWENHSHSSSYNASLTLKTFALSALVAYLGLGLSAFIYVPFGEGVMSLVQTWLFSSAASSGVGSKILGLLNDTAVESSTLTDGKDEKSVLGPAGGLWDMNTTNARRKLNPARLRDQMFAYTVTNQVVNTFVEVGLPFVIRGVNAFRNKGKASSNLGSPSSPGGEGKALKRVVFEDEKERGGMEERAFLDRVRAEVALPEYDLFSDYSEMVVQFGYVVLWSTIWPLAGVMAFLNNLLELRSDAFKITVHHRRPIPARADTIGPWLDALSFLTWFGALTNSALVYLFSPDVLTASIAFAPVDNSTLTAEEHLVAAASGADPNAPWGVDGSDPATFSATKELLVKAILVSLVASHGYFIVRAVVRHVVERVWWRGSGEVREREAEEREVKETFLRSVVGETADGNPTVRRAPVDGDGNGDGDGEARSIEQIFWEHDEGLEEIQRISKEV